MTAHEVESFLLSNSHLEMHDDIENERLCFRNPRLQKYKNEHNFWRGISYAKIDTLTADGLLREINSGFEVEGITRITGYFTKTSQWNPGKRSELRDRNRMNIDGSGQSVCPMPEKVAAVG